MFVCSDTTGEGKLSWKYRDIKSERIPNEDRCIQRCVCGDEMCSLHSGPSMSEKGRRCDVILQKHMLLFCA